MDNWRTIRLAVLRRDDFRCQSCTRPTVGQVHHIVPAGLGGSSQLSNLMTLCGKCHMLVSPVPDWVIRKVWNIQERDILAARSQVHEGIAEYCLQQTISNKGRKVVLLPVRGESSRTQFVEQIHWLNAYLSLVYDSGIRISLILGDLGFDEKQLQIIRSHNLEQFVNSCVASITNRLFGFTDGERLFIILNRRLKSDGVAADTLQGLSERLGISRERVRQLEVKVLRRCRHKTNREFLEATIRVLANTMLEHAER